MIDKLTEVKICSLYFVDKLSVHAIACSLGIHRSVVNRVIMAHHQQGSLSLHRKKRSMQIDPFRTLIQEKLVQNPTLSAQRIFSILQERGYKGGASQVRAAVALMRPTPATQREAFVKLSFLPGTQAQLDWAEFGTVAVGPHTRKLYACVVVLAYSRAIHVTFSFSMTMPVLLAAQRAAFEWFGGVPRECLYDNMKSAVTERISNDHIVHNKNLLDFASHYRFLLLVTNVRKPHEKGRVERAISYLRSSFYNGISWIDLLDLNRQALHWCSTVALARRSPEDQTSTVGQKLAEERKHLFPLPDNPYQCDELTHVLARKSHYVRFDCNDYSIPPAYVGKSLALYASPDTIRIVSGTQEVCRHTRCYGKGNTIVEDDHVNAVLATKKRATREALFHLIVTQAPGCEPLLTALHKKQTLTYRKVSRLLELIELYGTRPCEQAVQLLMTAQGPYTIEAVIEHLEQTRQKAQLPPLIPLRLPLRFRRTTPPCNPQHNKDANDKETANTDKTNTPSSTNEY